MSIIGTVAKVFSEGIEDTIGLARKVWWFIKTVWSVLVFIAKDELAAWEWMIHGAEWLGKQLGQYAAEAGNAVYHTLIVTIPKAIEWVAGTVYAAAAKGIESAYNELRYIITVGTNYLLKLISKVAAEAEDAFNAVTKWVSGAVEWVDRFGSEVWGLLSHPERLAKYMLGALAGPLLIVVFKLSVPVAAWFIKKSAKESSELAHIFEDLLTKVM